MSQLADAICHFIVKVNNFKSIIFFNRFKVSVAEMLLIEFFLNDIIKKVIDRINPFELYRHYKGNTYTLLDKVIPEWDPEKTLYIYMDKNGKKWARMEENFHEKINGQPRFLLITGGNGNEV